MTRAALSPLRRLGVSVGAAMLVVAACSSSNGVASVEADRATTASATTGGSAGGSTGTLDWSDCDAGNAVVPLQCATLSVPQDYAQPDAASVDIALARVPATGGDRIGSLVFNPGGPGGSGIDFLATAAVLVPADVARRFDLVGFDPRGVGASTALDCKVTGDDDVELLPAADDAAWSALVDEARSYTDTCTDASIELAPYVGTESATRDLDRIRMALGDEQLSYVGFSYGTRLGATYAQRFPTKVRALVLDGAVKPTNDQAELDREQAPGFDMAFEHFADACDADPDCALHDIGPAREVYTDLVGEIAAAGSFATDDGDRVLTPGELQLGVIAALYSKDSWPILAQGLADAQTDRNGSLLQAVGDSYLGRRPDGTYDNSGVANEFINCADDPRRPPVDEVRAEADEDASLSTYFADILRTDTGCIGIPAAIDPLSFGPATGSAPILVIGTTGDPATPYPWAVALSDSLYSAVLYTVEGEGHTAYLTSACVQPIVDDYLIDLRVPGPGGRCSDTAGTDDFPPAGTGELDQVLALFDCLRDHGADIPELSAADILADPTGETLFEALDPGDPAFVQAVVACQQFVPGS